MPEKKTAAKAAKTPSTQSAEQTFTKEQLDALVAQAVKSALENANKGEKPVVVSNVEEMVTLYYIGLSAPGTSVKFGELGQFNRPGLPLSIPKNEFFKKMTLPVTKLLDSRVVVLDEGLTEEERRRYGLLYKDGEVLTQDEFFNIVTYDEDKLVERYKKLCLEHKDVVLKLFAADLFENGGSNTTISKVKVMKKICTTEAPHLLSLAETILERLGENAVKD